MEGLKVKIVVFNHGEVPTRSGSKEKCTVMRCLNSVDFTNIEPQRVQPFSAIGFGNQVLY